MHKLAGFILSFLMGFFLIEFLISFFLDDNEKMPLE